MRKNLVNFVCFSYIFYQSFVNSMAESAWECCCTFLMRWLSLEMCITRILQQYGPLTNYFKSLSKSHIILTLVQDSYMRHPILTTCLFADKKQPNFRRLVEAFSNPLKEVYLLFLQATLPVFSTLNLLLQREKASIFQLYDEVNGRVGLWLAIWMSSQHHCEI